MSQANLVAHYSIFYRVFQWGVEQDIHFLPLYESHLYNAFAEASMTGHLDDDAALAGVQF